MQAQAVKIEFYDSLSAREKSNLDLYKLADKAGYSKQKVRSIIISALVEYEIDCTSLVLAASKQALVRKSLEVALGDGPEASKERVEFMKYYGYFR